MNKEFFQKNEKPIWDQLDYYEESAVLLYEKNEGNLAAICANFERMYTYVAKDPKNQVANLFFQQLRLEFGVL